MKVSEIIEDADINKGVIVSKNGFTEDGITFAIYKNIGHVELREAKEKIDSEEKSKPFDIGIFEIKSTLLRTAILNIQIDALDQQELHKQKNSKLL